MSYIRNRRDDVSTEFDNGCGCSREKKNDNGCNSTTDGRRRRRRSSKRSKKRSKRRSKRRSRRSRS